MRQGDGMLTFPAAPSLLSHAQVLCFDVFGTVVDWHGSIVRRMAAEYPHVDGDAFALAWREGYRPAMQREMARLQAGGAGWTRIDALHRQILDTHVLPRFGLAHIGEAERDALNRVWQALDAWSDSAAGIARLKRRYTVCTLSNGNIGLLTAMARHAQLPWDCILSADNFRAYKPDPAVYRGAADVFGMPAAAMVLVAAHHDDLAAARACGWQTVYVERPHEFGAARPKDVSPQPGNTLQVRDIGALADALGC